MTMHCSKVRESLSEDEVTPELEAHLKDCYNCSSIASGLMMLDDGLARASRQNPPQELNEILLVKVQDKQVNLIADPSKTSERSLLKFACFAVSLCTCFLVFDLFRIKGELNTSSGISAPVFALASKSLFDLTQLAVVVAGLFLLGFSSIKKVIICAALFTAMVLIEVIRLSL